MPRTFPRESEHPPEMSSSARTTMFDAGKHGDMETLEQAVEMGVNIDAVCARVGLLLCLCRELKSVHCVPWRSS